ncbi:hypothetical protein DDB_G0280217 [Dictyostelium discoideum AX4]|uniref:Putative uncharacterized protein DDB_G0280217 n=1 Tax=Dictyostelium discoideum TaxID=44689 RepID=Y6449_DICDI|nr:hypothetical protein DDB_G0280217 [Dictyostelium discoideum AX4]Q54VP3.1 RecName: Full=Putative uncharacterized protein DDB_G0280217 [Dictyostelium discoideum]EAL67335.1 hypothetical protein DDB_G0280217 [Dictyostelium discoideum AX4]|eukprot:XP_641312.1 hypothetical protein DDB_G0280217 [Dictyostelium discoideum AX4]
MSIFRSLSSFNISFKSNKSNDFNFNNYNGLVNQSSNELSRWNPKETVVFVKQGGKDRIAA